MHDGEPITGGVLRLYGPGSMDHLDPASSYYALGGQIIRLFARQLFTYRAVPDLRDPAAITPVPDLAAQTPTRANGGISEDLLRYTIRLRPGVRWDTTPPREVTAADVVRGLKRMANPVCGTGMVTYVTSTIRGLAEFRAGYAAAVQNRHPSAGALAAYQNAHEISGVHAADQHTVVIELLRPANDLLNILALTATSPAPAEYDAFVPDSEAFRAGVRSNGPYRITRYVHGKEIELAPNPVWRPETDPVRHQYLDGVRVTMEHATPHEVGAKIGSGGADLSWASPITEPYEVNPTDPGNDLGYALNPYLVFNFRSPNEGGAMANRLVRAAIAYAIDKQAIAGIYDRLEAGTVMRPGRTAIPPFNEGHRDYDQYPTPHDRGDPERALKLLAEAGYAGGLTLIAAHRDVDANPEVARSYAADLARIGITVQLRAFGHADYYPFLQDPANAEAGAWDLTAASWTPDWYGNNGRTYLQPMFQTDQARGTSNYGGYSNPEVDQLIQAALGTPERERAEELWHQVDRLVMHDLAIVPILVHAPTIPHLRGARVRNAIAMPTVDRWFDLSNLWLDRSGEEGR